MRPDLVVRRTTGWPLETNKVKASHVRGKKESIKRNIQRMKTHGSYAFLADI